MVNQHSTVTELRDYLSNYDEFRKVKAAHITTGDYFVFEAHPKDESNMDITEDSYPEDIAMVFETYGMSVSAETTMEGSSRYYRFTCPEERLIDNLE